VAANRHFIEGGRNNKTGVATTSLPPPIVWPDLSLAA
jgi:hypothetical protein